MPLRKYRLICVGVMLEMIGDHVEHVYGVCDHDDGMSVWEIIKTKEDIDPGWTN